MTAIIGVLCTDGVVIGTDSAVTLTAGEFRTTEHPFDKLDLIGEHVILAGTGFVGFGQRFAQIVQGHWDLRLFGDQAPMDTCMALCKKMMDNLQATHAKLGKYGALLAFAANRKHHLCEFDSAFFQPELKTERLWYVSLGITQPMTDAFLGFIRDVYWREGPPKLQQGIFVVNWTLQHAIALNPGGVNGPPRIAVLDYGGDKGKPRARRLTEQELREQNEHLDELKIQMRDLPIAPTLKEPPKVD